MANKSFLSRIQLKSDTSDNWEKATNFIPLKGEIIIYSDLNKIKIGDGITKVESLLFTDAKNAETVAGASLTTMLSMSNSEIPTARAVKVSPSFIGIPTAPTATVGTNTMQIATTAFVKTASKNLSEELEKKLTPEVYTKTEITTLYNAAAPQSIPEYNMEVN